MNNFETKILKERKWCYESRANKYYSSRIVLHKAIKKKKSINKIKIIKMT